MGLTAYSLSERWSYVMGYVATEPLVTLDRNMEDVGALLAKWIPMFWRGLSSTTISSVSRRFPPMAPRALSSFRDMREVLVGM